MKIIQISAKNLGGLALPSFCPRCFWIRLKCRHKLPFQAFPGIFASIDSYSKKVTQTHFRQHGRLPQWFDGFGRLGTPIPVPGWSRFQMLDRETNILVTGVPDEILRHATYGIWIGDYKTARFTNCQDALAPMYATQLNCYGLIAPKIGLGPVYGLGLLYYEPVTDPGIVNSDSLIKAGSFFMEFSPKIRHVKLEPETIPPLLRRVREIADLSQSPPGRVGCADCDALQALIETTKGSFSSLKEDLFRSLNSQGHVSAGQGSTQLDEKCL